MSRSKKISFENRDKFVALGLNIAYYRKQQGLTQDELAERADISRSHMSSIEAPNMVKSFSLEILFRIADVLKVDAYKLLIFRD